MTTDQLQTLTADEVEVGQRVPPYSIPLTVQRLVMEAGANRDFAPIHHDRDIAQAAGAPDMYANTMFLQTLFEVTLRRWMGPAGRLRRLAFSMRIFNCVGDLLTCEAEVTGTRSDAGQCHVDLDVWVESTRGRTVVGTATVELPGSP